MENMAAVTETLIQSLSGRGPIFVPHMRHTAVTETLFGHSQNTGKDL